MKRHESGNPCRRAIIGIVRRGTCFLGVSGPGMRSASPSPSTPNCNHAARARVGPRSGPPCFFDPPERLPEEIALVVTPQLLAGDGERRTRHATCEQVDTTEGLGAELVYVFLTHVPFRPVRAERRARVRVDLDGRGVVEPRLFQ